jgi:hypothetical protein
MRITSGHRNAKGQFQPGNPGGRGNPHNCQLAAFHRKLAVAETEEAIQALARELTQLALNGNVPAANFLLTTLFGNPNDSACMQLEESPPATPVAECFNGVPSERWAPSTGFNGETPAPRASATSFNGEHRERAMGFNGKPSEPCAAATGFNGEPSEPRTQRRGVSRGPGQPLTSLHYVPNSHNRNEFNGAAPPPSLLTATIRPWQTALTVSWPRPREPGIHMMLLF